MLQTLERTVLSAEPTCETRLLGAGDAPALRAFCGAALRDADLDALAPDTQEALGRVRALVVDTGEEQSQTGKAKQVFAASVDVHPQQVQSIATNEFYTALKDFVESQTPQ